MAAVLFIFILVFIFSLLPEIIPLVARKLSLILVAETSSEQKMKEEYKELKIALRTTNMSDEFAKYARTERKLNKMKEDLKQLSNKRNEMSIKCKLGLRVVLQALQVGCFIRVIWSLRYEPLLELPEEWFWPFASFIAFPSGIPGAVGITCWLIVCRGVVSKGREFVSTVYKAIASMLSNDCTSSSNISSSIPAAS